MQATRFRMDSINVLIMRINAMNMSPGRLQIEFMCM